MPILRFGSERGNGEKGQTERGEKGKWVKGYMEKKNITLRYCSTVFRFPSSPFPLFPSRNPQSAIYNPQFLTSPLYTTLPVNKVVRDCLGIVQATSPEFPRCVVPTPERVSLIHREKLKI